MKISQEQLKKIVREVIENEPELQEIFGLGSSDDPTSVIGRFGQWRQQRKDVKAGKAAATAAGKEAAINKKQYDAAAQKAIKIDKLMQPFKAKFEKVKQDYENDDLEMPQVDKALKAMQARLDGFFNAMKSYNLTPQQPAASAGEPQLQAANPATTNENFSRKYKFGPKAQVKIAQLEEAMRVYENERLQEALFDTKDQKDARTNTQRQAKYLNILNTVGQQMNRYINFFNTAVKPALDKRPEEFKKKAKAAPAAEPAMQAAATPTAAKPAQPETPATPAAVSSDSAQTATQGPDSATTDATTPPASGAENVTQASGEATTSATAAPAGEAPASDTPAPASSGSDTGNQGTQQPLSKEEFDARMQQLRSHPKVKAVAGSGNLKAIEAAKREAKVELGLTADAQPGEYQGYLNTLRLQGKLEEQSKKPVSYNKLYENWRRFTKG